jgi:hypothetical protein
MKIKYQIKSKEGIVTFDKKDDFLKKCSFELNETQHKRNRQSDIHYSYDYGKTWNHILNLKNDRQTIQNEKKPQNENMNNSKKSESKSGWGWGTYLIIVLWIWIGLTFIDSKVKRIDFIHRINTELKNEINKNNQEVIPNNQNNEEKINITPDSSDVNNDEPIQNEVNSQTESYESYIDDNTESSDNSSQTESNDNSSSNTYQQPERQKQWVNCSYCRGKGEIVCTTCNGTTLEFCGTCGGRGTFNGPQTCYYCKGALKVKCTNCNGKGNQGRCPRCGGRGQVQE